MCIAEFPLETHSRIHMLHEGPIAGIAVHGDFVATAGYDNKLILWSHSKRRALARGTHDHLVNNCAFSSDGKWLVSASSDYSARLWAIPSMRLQAVLAGHGDDVDMAVFSSDDKLIATCALDRLVRIFDLSGRCLVECRGHTGNVLSLAWTPDNSHVVSTSVDGTIRTWDVKTGEEVKRADLKIRTDSLEISSTGDIYAGDDFGRIVIIVNDAISYVQAHQAGIKKVALNPISGNLVCLSYDKSMSVWDIRSGVPKEISRSTLPDTVWARAAAILDDGHVVAGTFGGTYAVFDLETATWDVHAIKVGDAINDVLNIGNSIYSVGDAGKVRVNGELLSDVGSLCNFLVSSNEHVYTGGQTGKVFDAHSTNTLFTHHSPLNCAVAFFANDLNYIAIGSYTGEILVFEVLNDGALKLWQEIKVYENAIKGLSYSNGQLFSVCASTDIAWHSVSDWTLTKRISKSHEKITNDCCSIGDDQFATVSRDRTLKLWSPSGTEVFESPHPNSVKCISVNDEKNALLTGSYGGTLAMFDLEKKCWTKYERPTIAGISSIAWDKNANQFLAASYDGKIYPLTVR